MKNNLLALLILTRNNTLYESWVEKVQLVINTRTILCVMILVIATHLRLFTLNELSCKMDILCKTLQLRET